MTRKRMDGVAEEVTKQVEVSKLVEPKFLTLTGRPANQVAFKVVRDDQGGETTMTEKAPAATPERRRRIRSSQRSSLLFIEFPEGATDEDVVKVAEEFGLEDYEITCTSDGRKCLKRNDLTAIPDNAVTVMIGEGRKAGVLRAETSAVTIQDPMPYIDIVAIEFAKEKFDSEGAAIDFLKRYDIDFLEKGVENTDKLIRVLRSEVAEDAEVRRVEVETGVVAVVTRAAQEVTLVSSPFTEVVCEECYGQWGWGQLDFNAIMADIEFCEAADEATYRLRNLVERILFYSQLPVSARKELINRAAGQFATYIGTLLDGLPAKVVLVNRSNLEKLKEQESMTAKTEEKPQAAAPAQTAEAGATGEQPITRAELSQMIAEGVTAALAAAKTAEAEPAQRSDEPGDTSNTQGEDAAAKVLASVEAVAQTVTGLATSMQAVAQRLDSIEGATTVRSDGKDSAVAKPKDPFAGVFSAGRK